MINKKLTYISLFSSAGVGCYGFKTEGFECIATNELLEKRLAIQKLNNKCNLNSGYIQGDIKDNEVKNKIYHEINVWKKLGNDRVDVIIATPPCQGMSVANHKKTDDEIDRNSLIRESVEIIKKINPRFFVFENVPLFWSTGCVDTNGVVVSIGELITNELSHNYVIENKVINFKNYGSKSSRTRSIVIGMSKIYSDYASPIDFFPDFTNEVSLQEAIGDLIPLNWGEYDVKDFYHSFRTYPEHMQNWISDLKQGESAFSNTEISRLPHKIINGSAVINKAKNGDKYKRQSFDKVGPCIHTRNDQLASQNTIHPVENRVFSIRELMILMTIPNEFIWLNYDLETLNNLTYNEKRDISKKNEMNIRQSIGEAVPTVIFKQIAHKINDFMKKKRLKNKQITEIIRDLDLTDSKKLIDFITKERESINFRSLGSIIEHANSKRQKNSAFFTNTSLLDSLIKHLPDFQKDEITIIEPSVGIGNFLPHIFKKYDYIKKVNLKLIDIDPSIISLLQIMYQKEIVPRNFNIQFICSNFLDLKIDKVDLIIGNPPFTKVNSKDFNIDMDSVYNKNITNLAGLFMEKALKFADYVSLIMPKNLLSTLEYELTRELINSFNVQNIIDFGERGFKGVLIETINIIVSTIDKSNYVNIYSVPLNIQVIQNKKYIFDRKLPYWVIYRDEYFDQCFKKMRFNVFTVFRDRQITNSMINKTQELISDLRVLKSRNISDDGNVINNLIGYDSYISKEKAKNLAIFKYLDDESVYLTPNMTYNPRIMKKPKGYLVNGSVALLIPKYSFTLTDYQRLYISSDEFRKFYMIARNFQTRSLNIDKNSVFWFGIILEGEEYE